MEAMHASLGPKFKDSLPKSEDTTSQTAKEKEVIKINITWIGILIQTNWSEDIHTILESMVSDDWPYRHAGRTKWLRLFKSRDLRNLR